MSSAGYTVSVAPLHPWPPRPAVVDEELFDTLGAAQDSKGPSVRRQEVQDEMVWDADLGGGRGARIEQTSVAEQIVVDATPL